MSRRRRGGAVGMTGAIGLLIAITGCTSDATTGPRPVETADAYAAAIRWYLQSTNDASTESTEVSESTESEQDPIVVYVAPESGKAISSETQASVVKELSDMSDDVTVRFADVRDDVLDTEAENLPVKDDGVLLLVGQVDESAPPVDVDVAVYHNVLDTTSFVMRITRSGDDFTVTEVSEVVPG